MSDIYLAEGICKRCSQCTDPDDRWDYRTTFFALISDVLTEAREQVDEWSIKYKDLEAMLHLADQVRFECSNCCSTDGNSEAWRLIHDNMKLPYAEAVAARKREESVVAVKQTRRRKKAAKGNLIKLDFGSGQKKEELK